MDCWSKFIVKSLLLAPKSPTNVCDGYIFHQIYLLISGLHLTVGHHKCIGLEVIQHCTLWPQARSKPPLAIVTSADPREVTALNEFTAIKQCSIKRQIHVTESIKAIDQTKWYTQNFPGRDHSTAATLPFWPNKVQKSLWQELG